MDQVEDENLEINAIDLTEMLRNLLPLLRENDVHSFQAGGITVVFNEKSEYEALPAAVKAQVKEDDGHSTSNKRVDGFRNPALWQWQNGKVLKFDGSME